MAKSHQNRKSQKCDVHLEKNQFRDAYRIIRTLCHHTQNLSSNTFDDFQDALCHLIDAVPYKKAIYFMQAQESWINRESCYKTASRVQAHLYRKELTEIAESFDA
ncbi:hypothetical protein BSQ33_21525 (plasmid) [Vibrio gazogenes]|uniref:Uncharacterized protein n=1 Tax=Vibrio gazogenes TaxID=687 RepID=A0A1Z2SB88_VIBGA|nr:hypothetical protein BSQ33_00950 [Vibrio gazogenes]ASA58363.1 hypothetical protein BSQ33_21525 [Vibrio gazogenes]